MALTLPISLMSVPAIAQEPTPTPTTPSSAPAAPTGKALAQAKKDNRRVEIKSMRSERATFYANPDGKTVRMEMHTQPIRVKNADGKGFTPIDTTLVEVDGGMDTWINHVDYQESWNTFNQDQIVVGKSYASNIAKRWRGYLQFPNIPAEFAGSTVQNADMHLWNYQSNECGISVGSGITARRITSFWDDLELTWNTQPTVSNTGADTEFGAYSEDCTGSMNYAWDLTHSLNGIVQEWVNGATNYGIRLTVGNESELRNWRRYRSEDAGGCRTTPLEECKGQTHPPILTVDFELPEPPVVDGFTFMSPDPITSLPTYEEARARSIYEPTGSERTTIDNTFAGQIAGQREGEAFEVAADELDLDPEGSDGDNGTGEDTGAPQVVSVEPVNGAVDVPLDAKLKAVCVKSKGTSMR
ncbi:DNRLRE domain-containing protein [Streptosporangium sp. NBC_01755]|uniref:DNRLRE domain-containing protein n=1 Tax=unclassified Streptosporangium TaxID=2632669 RepID=UPI002DD91517|nr:MULTISPECIES: DNRLRE domain-containing protein [unclassified Streptosporangium]WSA28828.1 DNRLRE domain-containing protein [Streptosporangium sp. NBC_01810]WSC99726.1 DNRLRE domain-containing protein [Streptosporangium sp. NBC_01755]